MSENPYRSSEAPSDAKYSSLNEVNYGLRSLLTSIFSFVLLVVCFLVFTVLLLKDTFQPEMVLIFTAVVILITSIGSAFGLVWGIKSLKASSHRAIPIIGIFLSVLLLMLAIYFITSTIWAFLIAAST